ncbi:MAG TPA: hypothetical protein VK994_01620, partial [Bacteroidales bacterium]|nr:hypothetical protein [Bacteroidales bacterium]
MTTITRLISLSLFCVLLIGGSAFAQVLIAPSAGDPHPSAALEIRSENGGLLIPKIELNKVGLDAVAPNIPTPADG